MGFGDAHFLEHHFTDDDYLPSPMVAATAVAARTKTMRVSTSIATLPFYDPVRLAKDAAVLDVISDGRLDLGVGLGSRPEEFAGYGIDKKTRGARADEALQIIRKLWAGGTVNFHGQHFAIDGAKLSPRPVQQPGPPIWIGGTSPAALRRAAALGDGYTGPMTREAWNTYRTELQRVGKDPSSAPVAFSGSSWLTVSDDPERTFALYAPGLLYFYNSPSGAHLPRPQTPEDLKRLNWSTSSPPSTR